ncbi:MAG: hypothetical protein LBP67_06105 [Bacteroidales bacterium]|jgi:hypothetical protein|nr:hypothetical protein [Bacteroidales bacterium]
MKKILIKFLAAIIILIGATSCWPPEETEFDSSLLTGKWQSNTLFERYFSDGTGYTWDTADDVYEDEAQPFEWTLEKSTLTQIHLMEMGGVVPKTYTVTELTNSTFKYKDSFTKSYSFSKVN